MSSPVENVPKGGSGVIAPGPVSGEGMGGGRRTRRAASVKQLKKMLKKAGLKTTGKKASLTKRAKKAHLKMVKRGGDSLASTSGTVMKAGEDLPTAEGGKSRRRKGRGKLGMFGL